MTTQIDRDAVRVLEVLATAPRDRFMSGPDLAKSTDLDPERLNDAVAILVDSGNVEWIRTMGTAPFDFDSVIITARGRYEVQRAQSPGDRREVEPLPGPLQGALFITQLPPSPVGSPYGFTDEDWELVADRKAQRERLYVVLGHQFTSDYYDTDKLRANVNGMFEQAAARLCREKPDLGFSVVFKPLAAGYGEHLFNEIARDIISADIGVFETSDMNPNVMLEMGVALTWGVRVLPIKVEGREKPPSDISGQTWADYQDSGSAFVDPDHETKLVRMIDRAIRKKGR